MIDITTLSLIVSVVMCVIGVATFIAGLTSRAKQDGQMLAKIDFIVQQMGEIKTDVGKSKDQWDSTRIAVERILATLDGLDSRVETLEGRPGAKRSVKQATRADA